MSGHAAFQMVSNNESYEISLGKIQAVLRKDFFH